MQPVHDEFASTLRRLATMLRQVTPFVDEETREQLENGWVRVSNAARRPGKRAREVATERAAKLMNDLTAEFEALRRHRR